MTLFGVFTLVHYFGIVVLGSVIGIVVMEVLTCFVKAVKKAVEDIELIDGLKPFLVGVLIVGFPVIFLLAFKCFGPYEQFVQITVVWSAIEVVLASFFLLGAVHMIRGIVKIYLGIRHRI